MKKSFCLSLAFLLASVAANAATIEMKVYGLVCGFCAQGIEKTLRKNAATRDGTDIADDVLVKAMTDAGYDVKGIARTERTIPQMRQWLKTQ